MFITACNRFFQKHYRLIFAVILGMIIVPFVFLWGSPRDFLRGSHDGSRDVGRMYGSKIDPDDFSRQVAAVRLQVFLQYNQMIDRNGRAGEYLTSQALQRLRLLHEAHKEKALYSGITDAEVAKEITAMPMFHDKEGNFDSGTFTLFKNRILRALRLEASDFDAIVRDNMVIERLEKEKTAAASVPTSAEVLAKFQQERTKYSVETCEFAMKDFLAEAAKSSTNDQLVRDFYTAKVETYRGLLKDGRTPESLLGDESTAVMSGLQEGVSRYLTPYFVPAQSRVRVAVFSADKYKAAVKVTDDQLKACYESEKDAKYGAEVKASHILFKVAATAKPEEKTAKRKQLEEIRAKLVAGAKFEDLAMEKSDCPSKEKGGDLGFFGRGQMVKAFEDAAFALKPGELSGIVETQFGLHLIKVTERKSERTLNDVKAEVLATATEQAAEQTAQQDAEKFAEEMYKVWDNQSAAINLQTLQNTFSAKAAEQKIEITDSDWIRADRPQIIPFGEDQELVRQAAQLDGQKPYSEVIKGTTKGRWYVACHLGKKAGYLPTITEVLPKVRMQMNREKAIELARQKAKESVVVLTKKLEGKAEFTKAADELSLKFQAVAEFSRNEPPRQSDLSTVFDLLAAREAGCVFDPIETRNGAMVVYYKAKVLPTAAEFEKEKAQTAKMIEQERRSIILREFYQKLEKESNTEPAEGQKPKKAAPAR